MMAEDVTQTCGGGEVSEDVTQICGGEVSEDVTQTCGGGEVSEDVTQTCGGGISIRIARLTFVMTPPLYLSRNFHLLTLK